MALFIKRINISGLAGSDLVLNKELNSDVNIFFGYNGSGKTSLLKILVSALSNDTSIIKNVPFKSSTIEIGYGDDVIFKRSLEKVTEDRPKEEPTNQLTQLAISPSEPPTKKLSWDCTVIVRDEEGDIKKYDDSEVSEYSLRHRYLPTSRLYIGIETAASWEKRQYTEEELEQHFTKSIQRLWQDYNYDISIDISKAQAGGLANILKDVLSTSEKSSDEEEIDLKTAYERVNKFLDRQEVPDILGSYKNFKDRYQETDFLKNIIRDINDVEKGIEDAMLPKTKLENLIEKMFTGNKRIIFEDKNIGVKIKSGADIELGTLSSGEKQLLMIFIENLMAKDFCILIDEPEISMHIDWQEQLISSMRQLNPFTQIIMATHSPEISASVEDDKLFRL